MERDHSGAEIFFGTENPAKKNSRYTVRIPIRPWSWDILTPLLQIPGMNTFFFRFLLLPLTKGLNTEQKSKTSKGCLLERCWKSKLEMDLQRKTKKTSWWSRAKLTFGSYRFAFVTCPISKRFHCQFHGSTPCFLSLLPNHINHEEKDRASPPDLLASSPWPYTESDSCKIHDPL